MSSWEEMTALQDPFLFTLNPPFFGVLAHDGCADPPKWLRAGEQAALMFSTKCGFKALFFVFTAQLDKTVLFK